jgi:hypothetical protein
MYVTRTKIPAGARQAPARHAQDRVGTVLSGTLYVGYGDQFNEQRVTPVPTGQTWTIPALRSCFLWAKEGDVLLQVMGNG